MPDARAELDLLNERERLRLREIIGGPSGLNEPTARLLLLIEEHVKRLVRHVEGNGKPGLVETQRDNRSLIDLLKQRQDDCPARKRNWLGILGILLAAGSAIVSTAITLYTVVSNAPRP